MGGGGPHTFLAFKNASVACFGHKKSASFCSSFNVITMYVDTQRESQRYQIKLGQEDTEQMENHGLLMAMQGNQFFV